MMAIMAVVCVLVLVLFIREQSLKAQIAANNARADELNAQIEEEKARTDEIAALKEYYQSEEYIREVARDRLGLIEEGQIVFRPAD